MTKTNNLITINGKHFDARTGKAIAAPAPGRGHPKNIDGIVRSAAPAVQPTPVRPAARPVVVAATQPKKAAKARTAPQHAATHKPHPSKTLMRQVVHKPATRLHISELRAQAPTDILVPAVAIAVAPKLSYSVVDAKREARAKRVAKSKFISRFGDAPAPRAAQPASVAAPIAVSIPVAPPRPIAANPPRVQRSMDIFEQAMRTATSHEQAAPARKAHGAKHRRAKPQKSHRLASVSSAALAVLIIGGFLAYQNMANVTVRLASAKAGFSASLPGYKPSGFSVGKFAYSPGHVTVNFHSNSDDRHFALNEQPSRMDSTALLNDYVATTTTKYQTVQTAGRTLYIYGDNNATWVANGVWYRVDGNNSLSTTQLVNLASSM